MTETIHSATFPHGTPPGAVDSGAFLTVTGPGMRRAAAPGHFNTADNGMFSAGTIWTLEGDNATLAPDDILQRDAFSSPPEAVAPGTGLVPTSASMNLTSLAPSASAGATGLAFARPVACFCAATRIATPRGPVAVERLAIGAMVKTDRGPRRIKWIGKSAYDGRFIAGNHLAQPIRIRRHALGFNIPSRDLFISPQHAICEDNVLVPAWRLVNGASITQADDIAEIFYFHVELDEHAIIFAENAPVESFLDTGCRGRFQNAGEFSALYPGPQAPPHSCRPRIEDGFLLAAIQSRINARAGIAPAPRHRNAAGAHRGDQPLPARLGAG